MTCGILTLLAVAATLPTGWTVAPEGKRIPLDSFPVHARLLPGGKSALVLHSGYKPPSLALLNLETGLLDARFQLGDAGTDFAWDERSGEIFVPGGHQSNFVTLRLEQNSFQQRATRAFAEPVGPVSSLALSEDWVAVTQTLHNRVRFVHRRTGAERQLAVPRPTRVLFHAGLIYVLSNEPASLHVYDSELASFGQTPLPAGPMDLAVVGNQLFVAASNTNLVEILDLTTPQRPIPRQRLNLAPRPGWPVGVSPTSLHYDPAANRVYVVCSDANAVAVIDTVQTKVIGFVPSGWYPTFALPLPGRALLVLNGKGESSFPNPKGPNPTLHRSMTPKPAEGIEYIPLQQDGTGRLLEGLDAKKLNQQSRRFGQLTPPAREPNLGKLPKQIRHVIYIMKENRTYDQVLGDLPQGKGDSSLCLFPERITPNHHKLARDFVLFDNFYVNADVSSEGWHWSSAAIVPPSLMRRWPAAYAGRTRITSASPSPRDANKEEAMDAPAGGYLWSAALRRGVSFRNYGFFVKNRPGAKPGEEIVADASDPALLPHTNRRYAGYDPDFPDVERARIFLEDLQEFEKKGEMPRLIVMVLPNDHTWGTAAGKLTPYASMADNDLALGQIVEGVSKSQFWSSTAIFVLEDDAQNGPDHIDSHRAPAYIISPYTRRGSVDSSFYNTTSMLHTIEALLDLPALTHYDATSRPMTTAFQKRADLRPYAAVAANVSLTEKNPPPPATEAQNLDFSQPDRIDDKEFNNILWLALKGIPAPPPTRAAFLVP